MEEQVESVDQLYINAERLAEDFSLFPRKETSSVIQGLLTDRQIELRLDRLRNMDVDAYIAATVAPCEETSRDSARDIIGALDVPIINETIDGPFYSAECAFDFNGIRRSIGFIAQERSYASGVWGPEHHKAAADAASNFAVRSIPIVTLMDTPGADGNEYANANNQAHSISRLIAELCNVDVPTLGIIIGQGYSGGAIPLAASNLLLSLRTGVFNTIHPKGLANLVTRYNLSWQECAKFVGVSPFELYKQGNIDGIVDFDPGENDKIQNLRNVIVSGITFIEDGAKSFVANYPEVLDHYRRNINRYLHLSESLAAVHASSTLKLRTSPTEYPNVFGVTVRFLRYLGLRNRIKSTTTTLYGRLADSDIPEGELAQRLYRERRSAFLSWFQDPDKILYEDLLNKSWKSYVEKKSALGDERGRIAQIFFGEPKENYANAKGDLCLLGGLHLYNRWKSSAPDNLSALIEHLKDPETNAYLLSTDDLNDVKHLLAKMSESNADFIMHLKSLFTFEGKKLFDLDYIESKNDAQLNSQLVSELNLIVEAHSLFNESLLKNVELSDYTKSLVARKDQNLLKLNRRLLEDTLWTFLERKQDKIRDGDDQELTILDVILDEDVREDFIFQSRNLIVFSIVYNNIIHDLVSIAKHAHEARIVPDSFVAKLLDESVAEAKLSEVFNGFTTTQIEKDFDIWMAQFAGHSRSSNFLKAVEEWMRVVHKDKSDTLFVIISFFFEKLLPEYYVSRRTDKTYEGKVEPVRIGRRKDFWNRLTIAYRDLLFHEVLTKEKRSKRTNKEALIQKYVSNFSELNATLMSANPVNFPTFRPTIEAALNKGLQPCGLITGIGDFETEKGCYKAGIVISNIEFQVGCIDSSDCARFCKLLVECAIKQIPVICFVSSGGMQTKEGAAALFTMAAVNDRITRFVRDNDLPIIMFGFGDCTGGAQASFVTHPLVQTYYFTGTSMPFAGQAVVESNLPFTCLLSNYLSVKNGAMKGLVKHPFANELDDELRDVDPGIPLPKETVEDVVDRIMSGVLTAAQPIIVKPETLESELIRPVRKTLIHARGCTAVKLVRKAKEHDLSVVLVQSDPDMDSVAADMIRTEPAHTLVCIGGNTSDESYLNALSVLSIGEAQEVDSLHPGIGFLSEDPNFARIVRQRGINFVGPKVNSMETMGNKSNAINTTMSIHVPVVPGSHGIVDTAERAAEISENIGFPVLLKAVHGGGGKGIQIVERPEQVHGLFHQVTTEAKNAFGNGDIYIEKFVTSLRHIEVQILRDTHGNTKVLGLRDCSVQRNNQKLMEESGSTMLPAKLKKSVFGYAEQIANTVDYHGAGTVEFIYDVPNDAIYFMEMNTRLQVEHPVTEVVTAVDIVGMQFAIASGESISALKAKEKGYGLEVRINAEKAVQDADGNVSFVPTPGEITECVLPEVSGIDLISTVAKGKVVSPFYDSLIIQIICHGESRGDAISKMYAYLDSVTIHGICTNISLIKRILKDKTFIEGKYDTKYLPEFLNRIDASALIQEIEKDSGSDSSALDPEMIRIEGSDEIKVLAPSTGVFYLTPSPSEQEYIHLGDVISTGDVLCQLEAMKMFSPVSLNSFSTDSGELYQSDKKYRVIRINLNSGQQVNEGDLLFVIKPV
ncbi:MAG: biotin carboxylase N-terminal domain-containing protein [Candidatus Azotimanducaceae bacterium]|uniref:ATP-grasp domain-containing protein n=1 Tax=OM182 bacterium TaxID=2510334 RepID=A0A520S1F1_9GAMM|nr:carbamoyl-phosphate synthase large subunit [Gammaproteobacteria bacterium]RZO76289.1 MAG: ATP-grasp domain-containing protein [OM182 bacterium]